MSAGHIPMLIINQNLHLIFACRVQAGKYYHLFTKYHRDNFTDNQLPQMLQTRLGDLCLQIKLLKMGKVEPIVHKAIESLSMEALHASLEMLRDIVSVKLLAIDLISYPIDSKYGSQQISKSCTPCVMFWQKCRARFMFSDFLSSW